MLLQHAFQTSWYSCSCSRHVGQFKIVFSCWRHRLSLFMWVVLAMSMRLVKPYLVYYFPDLAASEALSGYFFFRPGQLVKLYLVYFFPDLAASEALSGLFLSRSGQLVKLYLVYFFPRSGQLAKLYLVYFFSRSGQAHWLHLTHASNCLFFV